MNGKVPRELILKQSTQSYIEGMQSQFLNGNETSIIKQPQINIQESINTQGNPHTYNRLTNKINTRTDILNEQDLFEKDKQTQGEQTNILTDQPLKKSSLFLRKECNIKDEKTVLKFSTLYVSKFIRRIKAVSSLIRFKEMGYSQFKIIRDPSSDYNYYFLKGIFSGENSVTRMIWIVLLLLTILINLIYIPLKYSFELYDYGNYKWFVYYLPQIAFISEILLTFFTACSWHKIGVMGEQRGEKVTWMTSIKNDSIPDTAVDYYVTSLYWAVVTMITLGYGDIVPKNQEEKLFVILITQVSCILFAYTMNSIGEILKEMGKKKQLFKQQMNLIDTYMRKRGLNQLTQVKVRKYFEYLNKESMEDNEQSSQLIQNLPQTLKVEVYSDVYGRVLSQKKIFHLHFSPLFLKELSLVMREKRLGPEEVLFKEKHGSDAIYIVMKGKEHFLILHLLIADRYFYFINQTVQMKQRNNHILKTLTKGDLFGETSFFSDQDSEYTAVTANVTALAVLKKKDFLEVIKRFSKDYEQYCFMKDNINLCQNIEGLDHKCVSCGSYTHQINLCQYVNFVRNKQKVLNLYTKYQDQKRVSFYRKRSRKSINTLFRQKLIYDSVVKQIFVASKTAKAQDLQEELSDMNSEDLSQSYSDESLVIDNGNMDEVEMSHAAISMISSMSPQFSQDFFQRTKLKRYLSRNQSSQIIKPKKTSQFAKYNKEDDFNIKQVESSIDENKSADDLSIIDQKQTDSTVKNNKILEAQITIISPKENSRLLGEDQSQITPKSKNLLDDKRFRFNEINQNIDKSFESLENENIENINKNVNQGLISTEENIISPKTFILSPKQQFLNMKRPKDPRLEKRKINQIAKFLQNSHEQILDGQENEEQERKKLQKNNSIVLYNGNSNQDSNSNPSEYALSGDLTQKTNLRLRYIKGEALKTFANDVGKASAIRYKSKQRGQSKSHKNIEFSSQFNRIQNQKQFEFDINSPVDNVKLKTTLEIPKIIIPVQNDDLNNDSYSKLANKKFISNRQINTKNLQSKFLSYKELGGLLSPIPHIDETSPYNFSQFSENFKQLNQKNKGHLKKNQIQQQYLEQTPLKLLKHKNSLKVNQINEEKSESSQMISNNKSFNNQEDNDQQDLQDNQETRSYKSISNSKKSDNERDQSLLNIYQNSDYIKQNSQSFIHEHWPNDGNFDKMKEFELYFPEQNYSKIINKYNVYRRRTRGYKTMIMRKKNQVKKKLAIFNKLHF